MKHNTLLSLRGQICLDNLYQLAQQWINKSIMTMPLDLANFISPSRKCLENNAEVYFCGKKIDVGEVTAL